ncbi:MAG TPA: carboxypeptidase-like regulatory domain-containing protein, partial [Vicingaceae bacterium]
MRLTSINILTVLLLFCSFQTKAQEAIFVGTILNASDSIALEGVHIINKSTNIGVVSKTNGSFSIMASPNDTLIISSVGFSTYNHVINNSYFNVYLHRRTYNLENFTVL